VEILIWKISEDIIHRVNHSLGNNIIKKHCIYSSETLALTDIAMRYIELRYFINDSLANNISRYIFLRSKSGNIFKKNNYEV
jgi:hypothetical protein